MVNTTNIIYGFMGKTTVKESNIYAEHISKYHYLYLWYDHLFVRCKSYFMPHTIRWPETKTKPFIKQKHLYNTNNWIKIHLGFHFNIQNFSIIIFGFFRLKKRSMRHFLTETKRKIMALGYF